MYVSLGNNTAFSSEAEKAVLIVYDCFYISFYILNLNPGNSPLLFFLSSSMNNAMQTLSASDSGREARNVDLCE